jgi:hypothetical protein
VSANNAAQVVRTLLTGNATVATLIGGRIYPGEAPDKAALPLIVYGVRLLEAAPGSAPVSAAAVDVHCYAATDDAAQALAVAADDVLSASSAGGTSSGTRVQGLVQEDWDEVRDTDMNLWGRLLRYSAVVVRG